MDTAQKRARESQKQLIPHLEQLSLHYGSNETFVAMLRELISVYVRDYQSDKKSFKQLLLAMDHLFKRNGIDLLEELKTAREEFL